MPLKTRCSGHLQAWDGSLFNLNRSYSTPSEDDLDNTRVTHPPTEFTLAPLTTDQKVSLCTILNVQMLFIESDIEVRIRVGSITNTPIAVRTFLLMTSNFVNDLDPLSTTGLFISNPSATDPATVTITAVGT